jgi:hypothetical protein
MVERAEQPGQVERMMECGGDGGDERRRSAVNNASILAASASLATVTAVSRVDRVGSIASSYVPG